MYLECCRKAGGSSTDVFGGLNARTGSDNTTETDNDYCETFDIFASNDGSSVDELTKRVSKGNVTNLILSF